MHVIPGIIFHFLFTNLRSFYTFGFVNLCCLFRIQATLKIYLLFTLTSIILFRLFCTVVLMFCFPLLKERLNSDGHQFPQYQSNQ